MQCNRIGRAHAYSRMLLSLMRDRMLRERRRQSGRLKVRRRWSDDPTMPIGSAQDALDIAEAMLEFVPRQQEYERLWKGIAARPLAGLLYAGSVQGNARGIEWVRHALVNIDADASVPGWRHAPPRVIPRPGSSLMDCSGSERSRHRNVRRSLT